jgi:branched-chain amino acid transport system substrate-binding protein
MKIARSLQAVAALAAVGLLATACGGNLDGAESSSAAAPEAAASEAAPAASEAAPADGGAIETIKVGMVTPQTGPIAGFGAADEFIVSEMSAWFASNPIEAGGKKYQIETIIKDSQSDPKRAGEVAAELINTDGVDVVMAHGTPDTVNPVADQCEANAVPCITSDAPWQAYYFGRGGTPEKPFKYTYHFFWGLEDVTRIFLDMWSQVPTNKKVGGLFPNDPDGTTWAGAFPDVLKAEGYTLNDPGLYENGTQDFSAQISAFKKDNDEILTGVPIPPDFTNFWKQAKQQGYNPKVATIGKALLFPSSVEALGPIGNGLTTEVWWSPAYPFKSSVTGQSAAELASAWTDASGKQWTQPIGFVAALYEVLNAAIIAAGGPDKEAIIKAMSTLKVDTIVGPLDWTSGPVANVSKTPLAGGQWRQVEGGQFPWDLVIVSNAGAPEIPVASKVEPLS